MAGGRLLHRAVGLQLLCGMVRISLDGHPQRHHLHPVLFACSGELFLSAVLYLDGSQPLPASFLTQEDLSL